MTRPKASTSASTGTGARAPLSATPEPDLIELPTRSLTYRGVRFSRSSLYRLAGAGEIQTVPIRFSGSAQRRRVILRESLDAFLDRQVQDGIKETPPLPVRG